MPDSDTIQLLNPFLRKARISVMHFYDGRAPIEGGVVSIPVTKPHWVQRALIMGFNKNPDGSPYRREAPQPEVEDSAESAGVTNDEGADAGGQSPDLDGVRESEPQGDDSPEPGEAELGTGSSDQPAEGTEGDGAQV